MKVAVTGGSGGAGGAVVEDLVANGISCVNLDINAPKAELCPFRQVDLTDYDATFTAIEDTDAVVHFGGNPHPDFDAATGADRFQNNTVSLFNVFNAAGHTGSSALSGLRPRPSMAFRSRRAHRRKCR